MFACIHLLEGDAKRLADCAAGFSPEAELTAPNDVLFNVSRLSLLYGGPAEIGAAVAQHARTFQLNANVAIAPNTEAALMAARNLPGLTVIPEGAADALSKLYIENLPLTPQLWELLESWGIRTFRDLARLPDAGLAERFGAEGVYLQRLARGEADRPLRIQKPEITFEERVELETAVTDLQPLLFVLSRILNDQCAKLDSHGFATNELKLTLDLERRTQHIRELRLPIPMCQSMAMLKLLQLDLEAHPPKAPIIAAHLMLKPVPPRSVQNGIFLPPTPTPDKLEITMTRIRKLVGELNVGVPELRDTHRTQPFHLVPKQPAVQLTLADERPGPHLAFRYFNPPLAAQVDHEQQRPLRLAAGEIRGTVITHAGPWRSSGDWWTDDPWIRDEWDVSLNDGAIYRIYRDPTGWYIEGMYD